MCCTVFRRLPDSPGLRRPVMQTGRITSFAAEDFRVRPAKTRHAFAWIGVGIALWLGVLGLFISFYPGAETWWFGTAAAAAALGLLSPGWRLRVAGVALTSTFVWFAWLGYQRGREYEEWLREEMPRIQERLRQRQAEPGNAPDPAGM